MAGPEKREEPKTAQRAPEENNDYNAPPFFANSNTYLPSTILHFNTVGRCAICERGKKSE